MGSQWWGGFQDSVLDAVPQKDRRIEPLECAATILRVGAALVGSATGRAGPDGEIGRHKGLKIPRRKPCRFESGPGHQRRTPQFTLFGPRFVGTGTLKFPLRTSVKA